LSTRTIGFCTDIIEKITFEESELHKELDNIISQVFTPDDDRARCQAQVKKS
jgi:hypothetical protein